MNDLFDWFNTWGIPLPAQQDLMARLTTPAASISPQEFNSESTTQAEARIDAAGRGIVLWRNNVGVLRASDGRVIRFGLCNDSARLNKAIKSADLIGIAPVRIEPEHVGQTVGQFISVEAKHRDWKYSGDEHERAQLKWQTIVQAHGGRAFFSTGGIK